MCGVSLQKLIGSSSLLLVPRRGGVRPAREIKRNYGVCKVRIQSW